MYEEYTRQSLPTKNYRELLGSAICVFNSNVGFIIENVLNSSGGDQYTWYELIDKPSGDLATPIKETITKCSNTDIAILFSQLVSQRNRIIHSFRITDNDGEQILGTKDKQNQQYNISEEYLLQFMKKNQELSDMLYAYRGH